MQMHRHTATRMSSTQAQAALLHQAPLRLIALPLCRNPDLVYYLPHKARSNDAVPAIEAGNKGKEKDHALGPDTDLQSASTDSSTARRERSAQTEQQSGSGGNVGGGGGSDLADRIAALVSKATSACTDCGLMLDARCNATKADCACAAPAPFAPLADKATEQWEKFGKAKPGNWKYRIYVRGTVLAPPSVSLFRKLRGMGKADSSMGTRWQMTGENLMCAMLAATLCSSSPLLMPCGTADHRRHVALSRTAGTG